MTRLLGIDLGAARIGLAIGDERGRARPLTTLRRAGTPAGDARTLARLVAEQGVAELVVGLPLEMSGDEGPQASTVRAWGNVVGPLVRVPIRYRDERRTTIRAAERIGPARRGRAGGPPTPAQRAATRARLDREAACLILQDEIDARAASFTDTAEPSPRPFDPGER